MFDWKKIASIFVNQCSFTEINTPLIVDLNTTREMSNYLLKQILFCNLSILALPNTSYKNSEELWNWKNNYSSLLLSNIFTCISNKKKILKFSVRIKSIWIKFPKFVNIFYEIFYLDSVFICKVNYKLRNFVLNGLLMIHRISGGGNFWNRISEFQ